jgi:hypothetical protein
MNHIKLNKTVQIGWLVSFAVIGILCIFNLGFFIYGLLLTFFLGINQLWVAVFNWIRYKNKSKFNLHLVISIVYLVVLLWLNLSGIGIESNLLVNSILIIIPSVLSIYFWYLTFSDSSSFYTIEHNAFDL